MKDAGKLSIVLAVAVAGLLVYFAIAKSTDDGYIGAATSGLAAGVASSTEQTVSTSAVTIFATSSNCVNRVISTNASDIKLTFTQKEGRSPDSDTGVVQLASTSVAYDSGLWGCDAVQAYSYSSQVIELIEYK